MTELPFQTYKGSFTAKATEKILSRAISEMDPRYFGTNSRFDGLGNLLSQSLIDYLGIYEEGDWWALTIIKVISFDDKPKYIFLPLFDTNFSPEELQDTTMDIDFGGVIFGLDDDLQVGIKEISKMLDAFADFHFYFKVINLFLPWDNLTPEHPNAYTTINESGIGTFNFHVPKNFHAKWDRKIGVLPKFLKTGDLSIEYGESYRLIFYKVLPTGDEMATLQSSPNVIGWITYTGKIKQEFLVAVLKELPNGNSF